MQKYECRKGLVVTLFNLSKVEYNGQHAIVDDVDSRDRNYIYVYLGQRRKRVGVQCIKIPLDEDDAQETIVVRLGNLQNQSFNGVFATLDYFTANGLVYVKVIPDGRRKKVMTHCCSLVTGSVRQGLSLSLPANSEHAPRLQLAKSNSMLDADRISQGSKLSSSSATSCRDEELKHAVSGHNACTNEFPPTDAGFDIDNKELKNIDDKQHEKSECSARRPVAQMMNNYEKEEEKRDAKWKGAHGGASGSRSACTVDSDADEDTIKDKEEPSEEKDSQEGPEEEMRRGRESDCEENKENIGATEEDRKTRCVSWNEERHTVDVLQEQKEEENSSPMSREERKKDDIDSPLRRNSWRKSFIRRRELFSKQS